MRLDDRTIRAFALMKNPELAPVVDWLKAQRAEALERLATPDVSTDFGVIQGEARTLKGILETIEQCSTANQKQQRNPLLQPVPR